ncbi:heme-binding protein soul3 isoform X1 [Oreochromis aureus]|uniref:heme-binding protein soul3 isoform X1 n=1 Tax=Oreochromis aureus TaxID=47969 RepID=UPI0012BD0927|nr:heme-binding protein soul3 isoform X1 [Oreochromis aureus]XP_039459425.1 heme-binding protein soul3 isoform X1 [Oreochromis aureus]
MDRGGCQMSGGGPSSGDGSGPDRHGMITLEDLESFSEDQLSDSGNGSLEEEGETMEEDENPDRLLHYWQEVARGHQVEVSQDMAEPIQQLSTNNQGRSHREQVPFTLLGRKEKCGEILYEKRHYEKGHWACITMREETYEQSICYGFMRIMRYICQNNSLGDYLGMTLPIVTVVRTDENHSVISPDVTVAYFLPSEHQAQPPQPHDSDIVIEIWPATVVYTRSLLPSSRAFSGPTNEVTIINQINTLAELLESPGVCVNDSFIVAGYTNPAHSNRQNEMWFLERR